MMLTSLYLLLCLSLNTFLVNSMPTLLFFDSGESHSFVSLAFNESFSISVGALDHVLVVVIAYDCIFLALRVFRYCVIEILGVSFLIYLIPIPMGEINIISDVDLLSWFGDLINCERQLVWVRTPSGGELSIWGEGAWSRPTFCSAARGMGFLQHGCMGL